MRSFILTALFLLFISARVFYTQEKIYAQTTSSIKKLHKPTLTPIASIKETARDTTVLMKRD
jgi:hypothetical protein